MPRRGQKTPPTRRARLAPTARFGSSSRCSLAPLPRASPRPMLAAAAIFDRPDQENLHALDPLVAARHPDSDHHPDRTVHALIVAPDLPSCRQVGARHTDVTVLELRPTCEHCNKLLAPSSLEARICSFECAFCATCVTEVLGNVCPNCGGGFAPRPFRPVRNWKGDNYLGKFPASTKVKHRPVAAEAHEVFSRAIKELLPEQR